ncbi:unnamed protein product [Boreogadus saida]
MVGAASHPLRRELAEGPAPREGHAAGPGGQGGQAGASLEPSYPRGAPHHSLHTSAVRTFVSATLLTRWGPGSQQRRGPPGPPGAPADRLRGAGGNSLSAAAGALLGFLNVF